MTEKPTRRERKQVQASKTCVDVDLVVNEKLGFYKDDRTRSVMDFEAWLTDVLMRDRKQSRTKKDRCEICNSKEDYSKLELHHYGGVKHDFRTVTACKRCHDILSKWQEQWDLRWQECDQPEHLRKAFVLSGLRDMLVLKTRFTGDTMYEEYADYFVDEIHALRSDRH